MIKRRLTILQKGILQAVDSMNKDFEYMKRENSHAKSVMQYKRRPVEEYKKFHNELIYSVVKMPLIIFQLTNKQKTNPHFRKSVHRSIVLLKNKKLIEIKKRDNRIKEIQLTSTGRKILDSF